MNFNKISMISDEYMKRMMNIEKNDEYMKRMKNIESIYSDGFEARSMRTRILEELLPLYH